jgi:hypothetical protein
MSSFTAAARNGVCALALYFTTITPFMPDR